MAFETSKLVTHLLSQGLLILPDSSTSGGVQVFKHMSLGAILIATTTRALVSPEKF